MEIPQFVEFELLNDKQSIIVNVRDIVCLVEDSIVVKKENILVHLLKIRGVEETILLKHSKQTFKRLYSITSRQI